MYTVKPKNTLVGYGAWTLPLSYVRVRMTENGEKWYNSLKFSKFFGKKSKTLTDDYSTPVAPFELKHPPMASKFNKDSKNRIASSQKQIFGTHGKIW